MSITVVILGVPPVSVGGERGVGGNEIMARPARSRTSDH
jgi:hypothetical protein